MVSSLPLQALDEVPVACPVTTVLVEPERSFGLELTLEVFYYKMTLSGALCISVGSRLGLTMRTTHIPRKCGINEDSTSGSLKTSYFLRDFHVKGSGLIH